MCECQRLLDSIQVHVMDFVDTVDVLVEAKMRQVGQVVFALLSVLSFTVHGHS
jgi:hypothetical protein